MGDLLFLIFLILICNLVFFKFLKNEKFDNPSFSERALLIAFIITITGIFLSIFATMYFPSKTDYKSFCEDKGLYLINIEGKNYCSEIKIFKPNAIEMKTTTITKKEVF